MREPSAKQEDIPRYLQEFPDYDDKLKYIAGFHDSSWHKDAMPSICKAFYFDPYAEYIPTDIIEVYQDYKHPPKNKRPENHNRYAVIQTTSDGEEHLLLATNAWKKARNVALQAVKTIKKEHSVLTKER